MSLRKIGAAVMLAACSSSPESSTTPTTTPAPTPTPATPTAGFWSTFSAGDIDSLGTVQEELVAARSRMPDDPQIPLVLGMSYVWGSAENERATRPLSLGQMIANADRTLTELRAFTELAPDEPRSWAHLGTAMVSIGRAKGDAALREEGRRIVETKTKPVERAEAGFALGAAFSPLPDALDYFFMAYEDCIGTPLDRRAPSFDGLDARRTSERPRDVCFNQPHWPHAEEGNLLVFGDTLEKAGKMEAARRAWEAARAVPTFASWKFKAAIADRLAGKPHEGVGAAPSLCTQCHLK